MGDELTTELKLGDHVIARDVDMGIGTIIGLPGVFADLPESYHVDWKFSVDFPGAWRRRGLVPVPDLNSHCLKKGDGVRRRKNGQLGEIIVVDYFDGRVSYRLNCGGNDLVAVGAGEIDFLCRDSKMPRHPDLLLMNEDEPEEI